MSTMATALRAGLVGSLFLAPGTSAGAAVDAGRSFEVEEHLHIPYYKGPDADPNRQTVDLYFPKGLQGFPVLFFVHGGFWVQDGNSPLGRYSDVARCFARQGVGVVLANYRLAPAVKNPEQVRDVARAFAWTVKQIAQYGGDPDRIVVGGHSAGGQLVCLMVMDESYLKAVGLPGASLIRGVIGVSGVYRIPDLHFDFTPGGPDRPGVLSLGGLPNRPDLRLEIPPRLRRPDGEAALPEFHLNPFSKAFGDDPKVRRDASPLSHVRPGLPPFLLLYAGRDLPTLGRMAQRFAAALQAQGDEVEVLRVPRRNHRTIMFDAAAADDPVTRAMLDFIDQHTRGPAPKVPPRPR